MSLRALLDGGDLHAFVPSDDEWARLQRERKAKAIDPRMPCCGTPAALKKNRLGTRYFSHVPRHGCRVATEPPEHLLAKDQLARAVHAAGWSVTTEYRVDTPDGEELTVDVLARKKGREDLAFQVQWTPLLADGTRRLQEQLRRAGIRGVWLQRLHGRLDYQADLDDNILPEDPDCPIFGIRDDDEAVGFTVPRFNLSLSRFAADVLRGELAWGPHEGDAVRLHILADARNCWSCHSRIKVIIGLTVRTPEGHLLAFQHFTEDGVPERIGAMLPEEIYHEHRIAPIRPRYSRVREYAYESNGCVQCLKHLETDRLYGNWYVDDRLDELGALERATPIWETERRLRRGGLLLKAGWRLRGDLGSSLY